MPGTIKLLLPNGTKEKEVHYYSTQEWKSLINTWIELYGTRIENYFIHIVPDRQTDRFLETKNKSK